MAHSLVPPTPGPLVVAEAFNVEIGQMMLGGLAVGIFATGSGFIFAKWINRKNPVPLRDTPDSNLADLKIKLKSLILSYPLCGYLSYQSFYQSSSSLVQPRPTFLSQSPAPARRFSSTSWERKILLYSSLQLRQYYY